MWILRRNPATKSNLSELFPSMHLKTSDSYYDDSRSLKPFLASPVAQAPLVIGGDNRLNRRLPTMS